MAFFYKPWTSEYQSQYVWKLRNQFRKPQDILEKQLEDIKALQSENSKKLTMIENSIKKQMEEDNCDIEIEDDEILDDDEDTKDLVLPKLSDNGNITKAEKKKSPPSSAASSVRSFSEKSNCSNGSRRRCFEKPSIDEKVDSMVNRYRKDGYGNEPQLGNKPTCFENERIKKIPPTNSKCVSKNLEENFKQRRAQIYDSYRREIDLKRLQQLFPYTNFNACSKAVGTQTYNDGIINGTYLSEYGSQYINWRFPYAQFSSYPEKDSTNVGDKYSKINSDINNKTEAELNKKKRNYELSRNQPGVNYYLQSFNRPEFQGNIYENTIGTSTTIDKAEKESCSLSNNENKYETCQRCHGIIKNE